MFSSTQKQSHKRRFSKLFMKLINELLIKLLIKVLVQFWALCLQLLFDGSQPMLLHILLILKVYTFIPTAGNTFWLTGRLKEIFQDSKSCGCDCSWNWIGCHSYFWFWIFQRLICFLYWIFLLAFMGYFGTTSARESNCLPTTVF